MTEVRWTPQAADDLQAIYDFIGRDSPHYARVIVEDILAAIDRLERFPLMGRHVTERPREDLRELIKPPYRNCLSSWRSDSHSHSLSRLSIGSIRFGLTNWVGAGVTAWLTSLCEAVTFATTSRMDISIFTTAAFL